MESKSLLVVISSAPYAGSDAAWNAIRLAETALKNGSVTRVFLINEAVDAGRDALTPPDGAFDLCDMLVDLAAKGAEIKYCKTCIDRCGVGEGEMASSLKVGSMGELNRWIMDSDRVVTF
ncbi:MAG: DsrE family protein [Nitrospinae bacterium]|nr:DsrE family protein [Nitrospinota bacterium]